MTRSWCALIGGAMLAAGFAACTSPSEPEIAGGRVSLRFQPPSETSAPASSAMTAGPVGPIDSVAVRVFRGGGTIVLEAAQGAHVSGPEPIELTVACIAESGKRVSVELFAAGVMSHHGADTNVDVQMGRTTDVQIDAYPFTIDSLLVAPQAVPAGSSFSLTWSAATAAAWYRVQSSTTSDFADIEWEQTTVDTTLTTQRAAGSHYFRVIPRTQFAAGTPAGPEFGYVVGGSGSLSITGFNPGAAIPGETFTIQGENLDYPGTRAWIGAQSLVVESASWNALIVRLPRAATTNSVTVVSGAGWIGFDTSADPLVVQRVAYVTAAGKYAAEYIETLAKYSDDFGYSGVAAIPVQELDWRDMGVFDTIIVAEDTGVLPASWGGGVPARAAAIASTDANVLAIGKGGAVFLQLVANAADVPQDPRTDLDGIYYAPDMSASVFTTPHSVDGPDVKFCSNPAAATLALQFSAAPGGVNLYLSTDKDCPLIVCSPNNLWTLADFRFLNPNSVQVVYCFWGYADDPKALTSDGSNCLANVMNMLYLDRP